MKKHRQDRTRTLQCESLERREMMSATATLNGGVLAVLGGSGNDVIKFFQSGKNIYINGIAEAFSASKVKSIYVDAKGGDDFISLNSYGNGGNKAIKETTTIVGGGGTDRVSVGAANDLYFGGQGNFVQIDKKGNAALNNVAQNLASTTVATLKKKVLTVMGTNGANNLKFAQVNGNIYISGVAGAFKAKKVNYIVIQLQDGNDSVSLDSFANGGNQSLAEYVTVTSGAGNNTVHLAGGHDVTMNGSGHTLQVTPYGTAKLDGVTLTWDVPAPDPDPTPAPDPTPDPTPPAGNWFDSHIQDAALRTLGSSLYADNVIDRNDIIALLQNAGDNGAVDATELADLTTIVNTSTLFAGLEYVERLTEYVVLGSAANAKFQGQNLGNLAAGSSTAQLNNLVSKWFLGLDRPTASGTYRQFAGQLFVSGPAYTDINQGQVGDCYLMESLAETALRSPSTITNMFVVNGDGTYTVKFFNYGQAEYVTVDAYLPTNGSGNAIYAGMGKNYANSGNELWTMLAEKAYVQANQFGWIRPGLPGNGQNAYSGIEGGYIYAAAGHITGQTTIAFASTASAANFTTFVNAWNAGKLIGFASKSTPASSSVVGGHAYAVIGYNSSNQTITLYNPWGPNYATVTMTWAQIGGSFSYFDRTA
jgi:Calpain family cysteine protease